MENEIMDESERRCGKPMSLCWRCRRSYTKGCSWAEKFVPVPGWTAEEQYIKLLWKNVNQKIQTFIVLSCPLFKDEAPNGAGERVYYAKPVEDENGAQELAAAIIKQALKDYFEDYSLYLKTGEPEFLDKARAIERWIRSKVFRNISAIDPEYLIELMRNKARAMAQQEVRRTKI